MNNSTVTPTKFDFGRWGNTSSSFIDSLDFGGDSTSGSVDGDGLFRDSERQKQGLTNIRHLS